MATCRRARQAVAPGDNSDRHGEIDAMPELGAWINHRDTLPYWAGNLPTHGHFPIQQSDLPGLLAVTWSNSTPESWLGFLSKGLIGAASDGNLEGVRQLLSAGAHLRSRDQNGFTPLHRASVAGHIRVVERLLDSEPSLGPAPSAQTRLQWQASDEGPLLVESVSIRVRGTVDARDRLGSSPLHLAAARGHVEVVHHLLHCGASPSACNGLQQTPLHTAATCSFGNSSGTIHLLLDAGCEVMAVDNAGRTPLHAAAYGGTPDAISVLVNAGARIEARGRISSRTPLHEACARLRAASVKQLLDLGADECAVDSDGQTPGDIVGKGMHPAEVMDPNIEFFVCHLLDNALKDRRWRRRRFLVLLRWREAAHTLLVEPSEQQAWLDVKQVERKYLDSEETVVAFALGLEEGVFRSIVSYL